MTSYRESRIYNLLRDFFVYAPKDFVYDNGDVNRFFHDIHRKSPLFYHLFFRDISFLESLDGHHSPDITQGINDLQTGGILDRKFGGFQNIDVFTVTMSPHSKDKVKERLSRENPQLAYQLENLANEFGDKFSYRNN
ncbi:hypothetical protein J4476_01920 [Candidatus Woesearchaeota archaeon]|nr:MAG: hypothetical protein QT09_C0016G0025 [archaeon GW2011_AR18]MBS3161431.1 hypothetical protein [Candidatus Woesearchaeota archaeon]HIH25586.1 hypothetical protein [Nanoarchaeota archaeon]